jgi:thiamine-monophosphate kinase
MSAGEFDLIERLRERLPAPGPRVRVGSGDDAAVVEPTGAATATTIDAIVEGIHFTLPAYPLRAVGRKALAAALSDLAAMGAEPGEAYVFVGAPEELAEDGLVELADGLAEVAERERVAVAGGDLTRAPVLTLCAACVGYERPGIELVARSGASPGDVVAVTGALGGAAAALELLGAAGSDSGAKGPESLLARQLDPQPRIDAGRALASAGATAMIDVSDGLGIDAGHVARASAVRLEIELAKVPLADGVVEVAGGEGATELALSGGEDYELLACIPPDRVERASDAVSETGLALTPIGTVAEGDGAIASDQDGRRIDRDGFDHMRGSRAGSGSSG